MRKNKHSLKGASKRVYYEIETKAEDGKTQSQVRYFNRATEPAFFKTYLIGEEILRKADFLSIAMLMDLVALAAYPSGENASSGGVIDLTPRSRQELMAKHKISREHLQSILGRLIEIGFMIRVTRGSYQINPSVCAKGQWSDVVIADDAFRERSIMAICSPGDPEEKR